MVTHSEILKVGHCFAPVVVSSGGRSGVVFSFCVEIHFLSFFPKKCIQSAPLFYMGLN
ncbi:unnamed protein product [Brassica oleracea]|uniref:Uncharacterized protein n=1 Tax=Brassica oleracea TaxID=3712 RepID=A0A3P6ETT8_BRAOL|nr:unnamed protein product [Brassica oleracea]